MKSKDRVACAVIGNWQENNKALVLAVNKHLYKHLLVLSLCWGLLPVAHALTYKPRMDQAQWISASSVLSCELSQPIPAFGRAVFNTAAGKDTRFYLETLSNPFEKGQAALSSKAPLWNPALPQLDLGAVKVREGKFPVELESALSTQLLTELYKGKSPEFVRRSWYGDEQPIEVAMSSVSFRDAYQKYRLCLSGLAPVGFDQLGRSRVHFESDKIILTDASIGWLTIMVDYLTAATDVNHIYVDGHTDDSHNTLYNIELSKQRAERVVKYLTDRGVPAEKITTRYHGERYPIKTNRTRKGAAFNRRVTMRIELIKPLLAER